MGVFWKAKIKFFKIFFKENKKTERILNYVASSNPFGCLKAIFNCWKSAFSVVRILSVGEKSILDLWKTEKSYRRKKRRYLSKSPFFSYFRGRIYFDRFTCDTLTKSIRTASFFEIDPCFSVGGQTYPLAVMGVALDRCLPGCYSMLVNEAMYYWIWKYLLKNSFVSGQLMILKRYLLSAFLKTIYEKPIIL